VLVAISGDGFSARSFYCNGDLSMKQIAIDVLGWLAMVSAVVAGVLAAVFVLALGGHVSYWFRKRRADSANEGQ
jgi:hypothetical protein